MASLLNAVKDAAGTVKDKVSDAADAVVETVKEGGLAAMCKVAEKRINELTGKEIEVDYKDIPDGEWKTWMIKTGINSLCNDDTWDFLEQSEYNARKLELWNKREIKKIILTVREEDEDEYSGWKVAEVEYDDGVISNEFTIKFCPRALRWASDNSWIEDGYKRWWNLRDEIVFGLQLYQLPGKCFYKSDFLEDGVSDDDPDSPSPIAKLKGKRWVQFRHWVIFWYGRALPGWNYQYTRNPPKNADGSVFTLDSVLSLPSMPDVSLPTIKMPELPDIEMPSIPDVEMPSAPSISAPSLSAPDLSNVSMPSLPDKKLRPKNPWSAHGLIEISGLKAHVDGKTLTLHGANVTNFWQEGNRVNNEQKDDQKFEFTCLDGEQADSWLQSLKESGVKEETPSGCCTVA